MWADGDDFHQVRVRVRLTPQVGHHPHEHTPLELVERCPHDGQTFHCAGLQFPEGHHSLLVRGSNRVPAARARRGPRPDRGLRCHGWSFVLYRRRSGKHGHAARSIPSPFEPRPTRRGAPVLIPCASLASPLPGRATLLRSSRCATRRSSAPPARPTSASIAADWASRRRSDTPWKLADLIEAGDELVIVARTAGRIVAFGSSGRLRRAARPLRRASARAARDRGTRILAALETRARRRWPDRVAHERVAECRGLLPAPRLHGARARRAPAALRAADGLRPHAQGAMTVVARPPQTVSRA